MRLDVRAFAVALAAVLFAALPGCGGGTHLSTAGESASVASPSKGQVGSAVAAPSLSFFAASRFAEQATFGPTPALIEEIRSKGFERWIDEQLALPASQIDLTPYLGYEDPPSRELANAFLSEFSNLAIGAPDQLRLRITWSLSQFIVVSNVKVYEVAMLYWINMLLRSAIGNYGDLLYQTSIHPTMGVFLDNISNRPKSAACPTCAPNENFARELMQLFSIGVFRLNADGSALRDANGQLQETYAQRDVEELARVLTGWEFDPIPSVRPGRNFGNWAKAMVPSESGSARDSGRKVVLGRTFPAGQSAAKDLQQAIDLLMAHPNVAPFVALRMIQHLVKSNPSPAYLSRMSAVFRDNGRGQVGDMKALAKAILLDPEARAGDSPSSARSDDGKIREPFLYQMALWRALGCAQTPRSRYSDRPSTGNQEPFSADSVFSLYSPTDRAPASNLLAPEQKLLVMKEIRDRTFQQRSVLLPDGDLKPGQPSTYNFERAGCDIAGAMSAFKQGSGVYVEWISKRFFRGAMPAPLRSALQNMMQRIAGTADPADGSLTVLAVALFAPSFGALK